MLVSVNEIELVWEGVNMRMFIGIEAWLQGTGRVRVLAIKRPGCVIQRHHISEIQPIIT
jgi:hypothetical protein